MSRQLNYFVLLTLCLQQVYQIVSISMDANNNTIKATNDEKMNVTFNLDSLVPKRTTGISGELQIHHLRKRAINPNQGSSWLKFVWRERQFKIPQMFLTIIRNLWAVDPAGGRHMFDEGVPYGAVYLIKTLLLDGIFPRIGKNQ